MLLLEWYLRTFLIRNFLNVNFSFVGQLANDSLVPVMMSANPILDLRQNLATILFLL